MDYNVVEIPNQMGELSSHYPSVILVPEYELPQQNTFNGFLSSTNGQPPLSGQPTSLQQPQRQQTIYESTYDANKLRDLINKARFAR